MTIYTAGNGIRLMRHASRIKIFNVKKNKYSTDVRKKSHLILKLIT